MSASDLVLASGSPRRAALLRAAGVPIEIAPVPCDETPRPNEPARAYAVRIARDKLEAALAVHNSGRDVLTADTVVWVDGDEAPLGKPRDAADCAAMLDRITTADGHWVTTAWALGRHAQDTEVHACHTRVWMRSLQPFERDAYLATDSWRDKAGGYGIQAEAASWVLKLEGSYTNVVGLPVAQVVTRLMERR